MVILMTFIAMLDIYGIASRNFILVSLCVKLTEMQTSRTNFTTEQKVDFSIKVNEQQVPPLL